VLEIIAQLKKSYDESIAIYEELELRTFNSDYSEDYEDTVERLYNQGYSDALLSALKALKALCVTCHKNTDIVLHGHCNACYYGLSKGDK